MTYVRVFCLVPGVTWLWQSERCFFSYNICLFELILGWLEGPQLRSTATEMRTMAKDLCRVKSRCIQRHVITTFRAKPLFSLLDQSWRQHQHFNAGPLLLWNFSTTRVFETEKSAVIREKARDDELPNTKFGQAMELQMRTPWHRDGANQAPVQKLRNSGVMTKGIGLCFALVPLLSQ